MKTSTIFGVVMSVLCFGLGLYIGSSGKDDIRNDLDRAQLNVLQHERDSLMHLTVQSRIREQQYILKIETDSLKGITLERLIALREYKLKTFQQRIDEISKINIAQPDSFLIRRYPQ